MQMMTEIALERAVRGVFTRQEAACWINATGDRLNALLKRSVGSGELVRIIRGLYCLDTRFQRTRLNPLELAQRIQGPSYISLEYALSYHGWIPEAVYTVTSTSLERSRTFTTPLGVFSYTRVPQASLYRGVNRIVVEGGGSFLMAEPLKALADYVYAHQCLWDSAAPLRESLRVDGHALADLDASSFEPLLQHYRSGRVQRFLLGLKKDLGL
ncbi:MAG: hypothetical protein WCK89_06425 [bacterium]